MVEAGVDVLTEEKKIARQLRESGKQVVLVASKADNDVLVDCSYSLAELGLGEVIPICAAQGRGVKNMLDYLCDSIPKKTKSEKEDVQMTLAFVGRPNVGKSSLTNTLLGEEKVIVSEIPGTTRDSNSNYIRYYDDKVCIIDTAGVRKRTKIDKGIESFSVMRTIHSLTQADVAVFVIDACELATGVEQRIAGMIEDSGCGVIIAINKWDLIEKEDETMGEFVHKLQLKLGFLSYAPVVFVSAHDNQRVEKILKIALEVKEARSTKLKTAVLNRWLNRAKNDHPPAARNSKHKRPKIYNCMQVGNEPPEIVFFVNDKKCFSSSYFKYLENSFREKFGLEGVKVKFLYRAKEDEEGKKIKGRKNSYRGFSSKKSYKK
jgi:GTP-binding protein